MIELMSVRFFIFLFLLSQEVKSNLIKLAKPALLHFLNHVLIFISSVHLLILIFYPLSGLFKNNTVSLT